VKPKIILKPELEMRNQQTNSEIKMKKEIKLTDLEANLIPEFYL